MPAILVPGHFYRSKRVLDLLAKLQLVNQPHLDPAGWSILVFDLGDRGDRSIIAKDGKTIPPKVVPPCLVPMAEDTTGPDGRNVPGGDILCLTVEDRSGKPEPAIGRVEIPPNAISDLEPLVEYDHLPTYRKDYNIYPRGHKLA